MPRSALTLGLKESDKQQLLQWSSAFGTPQQVALRCRIALAAAEGESADQIAARLEVNRKTVMLWRARFEKEGLEGLWEVAPGRGRKPTYAPAKIQAIVDATLRGKPKGMTHWSCRTMAQSQGVSAIRRAANGRISGKSSLHYEDRVAGILPCRSIGRSPVIRS